MAVAAPEQFQQTISRFLASGDVKSALLTCKELTEAHPGFAPGWMIGGQLALRLGNYTKAIEFIERASELAPGDTRIRVARARMLWSAGRHEEARAAALAATPIAASDPEATTELGHFFAAAQMFHEALAAYSRAAELAPESAQYGFNRATLLRIVGQLEAAEAEYDRVIALSPSDHEAYYNRSDLRRQTRERNHIPALENLLKGGIQHPRGEVFVRYALAKELEDVGRYAESFLHLSRGASLRRKHIHYDVELDVKTVAWIEAAYPASRCAARGGGHMSTQPIFVVGMPRSGSTLLERVLGNHSKVHAAGELPEFANALVAAAKRISNGRTLSREELIAASTRVDFAQVGADYVARSSWATRPALRFIDKLPLNYLYCGPIALALPRAQIIHMTRHPLATCYAMYKTLFKDAYPFSYDLVELARYYAAYRRLMAHWQRAMPDLIIEVRYEMLVQNFEREVRRVVEACGLDFEPPCLEFERNPHPTATASAAQVRRPLYDSSVSLWRHYERELEPVRQALIAEGVAAEELQ